MKGTGPFLLVAALCETVVEANDGRLSVVNVIEQVTASASGPEPPDEMPPLSLALKAVIALKAGTAKGRYGIRFEPEDPSGLKLQALEAPVQFGGDEASGVRVIVELQLQIEREGVYWIEVTLVRGRGGAQADELLTRIPLSVVYQPQKLLPSAQPGM